MSVVDSVDGSRTDSYTTSPVHEARTVTATFAINTYAVNCNVVGNGACSANPSTVDYGATSGITVSPASGWYLVHVNDSVDGMKAGSYTTSPVHETRTVTATFAALPSVPDLAGMTANEAVAALAAAGLAGGTVTQRTSTTVASGRVITQQPPASTIVAPNSAVDYTISAGVPISLAYAGEDPLSVLFGDRAELTVTPVNAHGNVQYQWYRVSEAQTLEPINGESSATLLFANVTARNAGVYLCEATDNYDSAQSPRIELSLAERLSAPGWAGLLAVTVFILAGGFRHFAGRKRRAGT